MFIFNLVFVTNGYENNPVGFDTTHWGNLHNNYCPEIGMTVKFSSYMPAKSSLKKSTKGQMSFPMTDTPVS